MNAAKFIAIVALLFALPKETYVAARAPDRCPQVTVNCPPEGVPTGVPITFTADISGGDAAVTYTYRWTVSAGTITDGQGTSSITVDTTGIGVQPVEAEVEIGGFPGPCDNKASCAAQLALGCGLPRKIDEYGDLSPGDERARLDNFAVEVKADPNTTAYVIAYAGRRARAHEARETAERAKNYLVSRRGVEPGRIVVIDGGHREERTVELYNFPKEAAAPSASPTVDPGEVITVKGRRAKARAGRL